MAWVELLQLLHVPGGFEPANWTDALDPANSERHRGALAAPVMAVSSNHRLVYLEWDMYAMVIIPEVMFCRGGDVHGDDPLKGTCSVIFRYFNFK